MLFKLRSTWEGGGGGVAMVVSVDQESELDLDWCYTSWIDIPKPLDVQHA